MSRADRARALVVTLLVGCGQQVGAQNVAQAPLAVPVDARATAAVVLPATSPAPPVAPLSAPREAAPAKAASPAAPPVPSNGRDALMDQLLGGGSTALKTVVATPEKYRFQVLYGVIRPGAVPTLERHAYR